MLANLAFAPSTVLAVVIGLAVGMFLGRYLATRAFRHQIRDYAASETLGAILSPEEQKRAALAFKDSAAAAAGMNKFSYAVPNVPTPFVGSGPRPGQNENAWINQMQFRARHEVAMPKPPDVYRIFLTGGSTAFGSGAPSQDAIISAYLERRLNAGPGSLSGRKYEALTLANPSWTSSHERILIENRLSELAPDMVISLSGSNDVHWAGAGHNINWFRTYADQHFWELLETGRGLAGLQPWQDVVANASPVAPALVGERLEKNVRLSAIALALEKARYVFILQPGLAVTSKPLSQRERELRAVLAPTAIENFYICYEQIRKRLEVMTYSNFTYLDYSDVFHTLSASDEIFLDSYHFGDRGNGILADKIAEGIHDLLGRPA